MATLIDGKWYTKAELQSGAVNDDYSKRQAWVKEHWEKVDYEVKVAGWQQAKKRNIFDALAGIFGLDDDSGEE